jgi:hypothetical protein
MTVQLAFNNSRLIPAPLINISSTYNKTGDGTILGKTYELVIEGKFIDFKGSPNSFGLFWEGYGYPNDEEIGEESKLGAILRKQQAIQNLFSKENNGKKLEIQSGDGTPPLVCYPQIQSVTFPADRWHSTCDYSISLTADQMFPLDDNNLDLINEASESWTIEPSEEREDASGSGIFQLTYKVNHSISAQGKRLFNTSGQLLSGREPWQNAKEWVLGKKGLDPAITHSGIYSIPSYYQGYDYVKTENIDTLGGQYSLTENWILSSGRALEQYELSLSRGINQGIKSVSIQGNIRGLDVGDVSLGISGYDRMFNATEKFNSISGKNLPYIRSQNFLSEISNGILHSVPVQQSVGKNPAAGTLTYSFEYDNRPSGLISGVLSEVINVSYIKPNQSFASVFVLGRAEGPVLQPLETSEARQKNLSIEFIKEPSFDYNNIGNNFKFPFSLISKLVSGLNPMVTDNAVQSFSGQPTENYDPFTGRGSYSVNWTYEV